MNYYFIGWGGVGVEEKFKIKAKLSPAEARAELGKNSLFLTTI